MARRRMTAAALALSAVLGWWALLPATAPGSEVAGSEVAGSEVAGSEAARSEAARSEAAGSGVAGQAAPSYRYWTYWHHAGGSWVYADTGPSGYHPADGSVDGWRYEVTADGAARAPRTRATFTQICGSTPAVAGRSRVAIVFDYGTVGDARRGQQPPASRGGCAVIVPGSTGIVALEAVATVRFRSDGIICAFDDYPSSGCVDLVGQPAAPTVSPRSSHSPSAPSPSASPRPTAPRTTRPTTKPSPRATAKPTQTSTRTTEPSPPADPRPTAGTTSTTNPSRPTPSRPTPSRPTPSVTRRSGAPTALTPPKASAERSSRPARATAQAASRIPSAPVRTSGGGSPSISPSGGPGAATAVAASAAGLILTGTSRPTTGGVTPATWVGLVALVLVAATAGMLALRRRRSRS